MADDSGGFASDARAASHQDGASRVVDLGGRVHYLDYPGASGAPTFLCLHGLGGSAVNFRAVAPLLRSRARVVAPDLLGHGRTYAGRVGSSGAVEANLDLIARVVDEVVGAPVVLVGHSLGGILALLHTMRVPSDVQGLVLLDPPVPGRSRWSRDWKLTAKLAFLRAPGVGGLVARQLERLTPEALVARQLADATPHVERIPSGVVDASVAEVVARRAGADARAAQDLQWAAILETIALLARPRAWRQRLAAIRTPVLWLLGEDDPKAPYDDVLALARSRPDWLLETRPGVGHLPHLEDPDWTADRVLAWVEGR
jgi:pimeloyl-ACP methyl ester carboxylesterase